MKKCPTCGLYTGIHYTPSKTYCEYCDYSSEDINRELYDILPRKVTKDEET